MTGKIAAGMKAVKEEAATASAAAQEATSPIREHGDEPMDSTRKLKEEAQVGAEMRLRGEEEGATRKKWKRDDTDPAVIQRIEGASSSASTAAAAATGQRSDDALPRCRCSMRVSLSPLQRLLDACRRVFNGSSTPPTSAAVPYIQGLMEKIGPHDVGLMQELNFFHKMNAAGRQNPPIITCKTIHDSSNFTIAVFFLPLRAVIPLHDHPGMTVFSKLLVGSAHKEAYDWVHPRVSGWGSARLAEKVLDHDVTEASKTWVLFPDSGGNMHRFVAGEETHCAFLDVLAPPYSSTEERHCTYYKDIPYKPCRCALKSGLLDDAQRHGRPLAWLEEVAEPRDLRITNLPYQGPTVF